MKTDLSIITPCFNEQDSIQECVNRVRKVMKEKLPDLKYEHILTDNNSTDNTAEIMRQIAQTDANVKVIIRSRNVGAPRNIFLALKRASGNAIIPMLPADLQDPPELIPELFQAWTYGYLIVYGVRSKREENFFLRNLRTFYYKVLQKLSESEIRPNAGEFMLIDKRVAKSIIDTGDKNPFIRGLVALTSAKSTTVNYVWVRRRNGKSKATPLVLLDQAINGLVSTSRFPARIALLIGFFTSFFAFALAVYAFLVTLFGHSDSLPGIPTAIVAISFFSGVQLFFLGVIGEYVLSIHGQVKPEPESFELSVHNF